jgi:predicted dienelactone hydrolase
VLKPLLLSLIASLGMLAQAPTGRAVSVPLNDAPELAARGPYQVGVRTVEIIHREQLDILNADKQTHKAPLSDRHLTVEVWYPALVGANEREETAYNMPLPGGAPGQVSAVIKIDDRALRNAKPAPGKRFPLVVVSHGYPGSRYFMTYLTANLASKGYVVAAIDHTDSVFGNIRGFESTLLNRSNDQLFTIHTISELAKDESNFLNGIVDASNAAVVGYSMGGYGALITAGAGLKTTSPLLQRYGADYFADWTAGSSHFQSFNRSAVKAVVAIAPWGNQPPNNAWDAQGLAGIRIPTLFIAGDHDDVSDFEYGIHPAFVSAVNSERCLLTYENARHNTGGNPAPAGVPLAFGAIQSFEEPTWAKDRITAINQHFITAFLDFTLKHDESKLAYLHVNPARSNDGKWVAALGAPETFSTGKDASGNLYWKGFRRRWALGLEMSCMAADPK